MLGNKPFTFDRVVRLAIAAALIWGAVKLLGYLSEVLIPFAVALLLAYLMNPLVVRLQKKVKNRVAAVAVALAIVALAVGLVSVIVVPLIMDELAHMGQLLHGLVQDSALAQRVRQHLPPDLWEALKTYAAKEEVREFFASRSFWQTAGGVGEKVLPGLWGMMKGAFSFLLWLIGLAAILLYLFFLLIDFQRVREGWKELIPSPYRGQVVGFVQELNTAMNRYFRAQALVAGIVGVLFALGFAIIGLPLGILLGLFVGLLNMVPYLQLIAIVPASGLAFIHAMETGVSFWWVLAQVGMVFVLVQSLQDGVLVPRIMGKAMGLSPAMILLSLSVWGKLLGVLGLLIALPITCLLLAYYRRFLVACEVAEKPTTPEPT